MQKPITFNKYISILIKGSNVNQRKIIAALHTCHKKKYINITTTNGIFPKMFLERLTTNELKDFLKYAFSTADRGHQIKNIVFANDGSYAQYRFFFS